MLHPGLEPGALVIEVEDEAVAARVDVFGETSSNPFRWTCDRVPAALVPSRLRLGRD
jgi:hypothetical protein